MTNVGPILITGAGGQVGSALTRLLRPGSFVATDRATLNLMNADALRATIRLMAPRWIVNCAAFTGVDAAEKDESTAFIMNATIPGILAEEAARLESPIIHFSTDYVFDGTGTTPWLETDETNPKSIYGESKLSGDLTLGATCPAHFILRTSWVYSGGGKNFIRTIMRLLTTGHEPIRVVADQHGAPTSAADLAATVATLIARIDSKPMAPWVAGTYNCTGSGETTWAGLADFVRSHLIARGITHLPPIVPVSTAEYRTPAVRPLNSRLCCDKLERDYGIRLPHWTESVPKAIDELIATDLPHLLHAEHAAPR